MYVTNWQSVWISNDNGRFSQLRDARRGAPHVHFD